MGKYYIQTLPNGNVVDIESTFEGLFVTATKGLSDRGKPKNVYTESFADKNGMKVSFGSHVLYEQTTVSISFFVYGNKMRTSFNGLLDLIKNKRFYFWDDFRGIKVELVLLNPVSADDNITKDAERIEATIEFANVNGTYVNTIKEKQ